MSNLRSRAVLVVTMELSSSPRPVTKPPLSSPLQSVLNDKLREGAQFGWLYLYDLMTGEPYRYLDSLVRARSAFPGMLLHFGRP